MTYITTMFSTQNYKKINVQYGSTKITQSTTFASFAKMNENLINEDIYIFFFNSWRPLAIK